MIKKTTAYKAVCDVCGRTLLCGDLFKDEASCERAIYASGDLYPMLGGAHVCSVACFEKLANEITIKLKKHNKGK